MSGLAYFTGCKVMVPIKIYIVLCNKSDLLIKVVMIITPLVFTSYWEQLKYLSSMLWLFDWCLRSVNLTILTKVPFTVSY